MRAFGYCCLVVVCCFLALLIGCASSPMQKADKLSVTDPNSAIGVYKSIMETKPGSSEAQQAHFKIADTYYHRLKNQEKGLEVYEEVAKSYPKTDLAGEANYALGMHYYQAKDYEKARDSFRKVTEESPNNPKAADSALAIGKCYEELKKYEEAVKVYEDFTKTHPQHRYAAQAGLSAAKIYEKDLEDTDKAEEAYKRVATDYSLSSSAREAREALTNMGVDLSELEAKPEAGVSQAGAAQAGAPASQTGTSDRGRRRATNIPRADIGSRQRTDEQLSRSVSPDFGVDPYDIMPMITADGQGTMYDAMYMFASMNLQSQQYKEAGALYEKAIELVGNKQWDNAAQAYYGLAKSYKGIGRDDKAKEMFLEAIKRDRKIIDSMIVSGESLYGEEDYKGALEAYKLALGLVPSKDSEIYYKIGLTYLKLGDADKELEAFEHAVALKPSDVDAVQHLAEVLFYRKKDSVRADLYDTEARGQGNSNYKVQMELGDLCYKYESYSWAKIKYNNAARLLLRKIEDELKKNIGASSEPEAKQIVDDPTKLTLKLVSQAAASGNKAASEALQRVESLLVEYRIAISRHAISTIRTSPKQYEQAQQQLDALKDEDPGAVNSAEFHFALGVVALEKGDKTTGLAEFKKALEIDPNHKEAADKLKQLGSPAEETSG